ncbi:hypothetical protein [Stenotrophomonas pigmentata]|uniref:hypothetical protein n=1 Tax=Stenotrophomonas pigmentata TaxID=3055080 RepID=UPI0026EF77C6|nr:hypothetical protein [Stenotrophomonas sp. 610A2]
MKAVFLALAVVVGVAGAIGAGKASAASERGDVRVLYEYPREAKYENLGVVEVEHYRAGFREPKLEDALPKLKERAVELGGNAVIVRSQKVDNLTSRKISLTAEVLRVAP